MADTIEAKSSGDSDGDTKPYADLEEKITVELESLWVHWSFPSASSELLLSSLSRLSLESL